MTTRKTTGPGDLTGVARLSALMIRVCSDDDDDCQLAFAQLYDLMAASVYSHALAVLRDAGSAEDIVQETMLAVWRSRTSYDPGKAAVSTWVMTICRRRTLDQLRRRLTSHRGVQAAIEDAKAGPDMADSDATLTLDSRTLLAQLDGPAKRIVFLSMYANATHSEIAAELGMNISTVKSTLYRALRQLRAQIEVAP